MANAFESIAQGLREAIALNEGEAIHANVFRPEEIDVGQLRRSLGLTQSEFAAKFCISLGTLRHWERGDRKPHGPALALLHVVAKEPQAVLRALA
jgi:putative transcriptional regulator